MIGLAFWGSQILAETQLVRTDALEVDVIAQQWAWRFEYPEQEIISSELVLPVDHQALLLLSSQDVIHSFWVPEFRIKQDAVPGRWMTLRVTPTETGDYRIRCAEMCGYAHSAMYAPVVVVQPDQFEAWLEGQEVATEPSEEMTMAEKGAELIALQYCGGCHSIDGSDSTGPTWLGVAIPRVGCEGCGVVRQVHLPFAERRASYTRAFERYALELSRRMSIQDVARHLGVSWDVIKAIPGVELVEMRKNRANALCCGSVGWVNCGRCAKGIQVTRLRQAQATGAGRMITACPKCRIHLSCALKDAGDEVTVELEDLTGLLVRAMRNTD